jgi:NodT family efflux transporter outer membrane factor (OMF) lipoprotein
MHSQASVSRCGAGQAAAFALCLALAGCAQSPAFDGAGAWLNDVRYTAEPGEQSSASVLADPYASDARWWQAVGGESLSRLVDWALVRNHDVGIALTRVREARAGETAQSSALWPSVSLQGVRATERSSLPAPVKQGRPDTRAWQASLNLDWELDLFGRAQAASRGAREDALASEAGVAGARLMLIAEVTRQHLLHRGALQREQALAELVGTQEGIVKALRHRAAEGEESLVSVEGAQARLEELRAQQRSLATLRAVTRARLITLTDASPQEVDACLQGEADAPTWVALPPAVPTGQPVSLLARRPDLIAAQAGWRAEQARRDAAQADMLPRFFVSLVTGRQDLRINGMDLAPVGFHESLFAFAMPLFNAGRLRAGVERQDAVLQRAELRYAQAVRQALEDVEAAMSDAKQSAERERDQARAVASRERAAALGAHLFAEGQIAAPERLALQQAHLAARLAHIDAVEAAWLAHIQLHKALGGGWQQAPAHRIERVAQAGGDTRTDSSPQASLPTPQPLAQTRSEPQP